MSDNTVQRVTQPSAVSIQSLVAILFRRKFLVIALFLAVFGGVAAVTMLLPREYESRMKIMVKNERADLVLSPDARGTAQLSGDVSEQQVNSEIELLGSNTLLASVVRQCRLYDTAETAPGSQPSPASIERAARKLERDLKIAPARKTNIIQVTYSARTPETAAAVLTELSNEYLDAHLKVHRSAGTQDFFRAQSERFRAELLDAESRLSGFRRKSNLTSIVAEKDLMLRKSLDTESQLREAGTALAEAGVRTRQLQRQVDAQEGRILTQSRTLPNQYSVERLNTMLAELENRRTQALMKFRPEDRIVAEIQEEIANTRGALDRAARVSAEERATDVNPLRQTFEGDLARTQLQETGLSTRYQSLAAMLAVYRGRLAELEDNGIEDDTLERNVKEAEQNYLLYTRKQEEARIADSLNEKKIANVTIAEAPVEQHIPARPNTTVNLLMGALLAALTSLGAAFGLEYAGERFYTPAELESATGLPVLTTLAYERP